MSRVESQQVCASAYIDALVCGYPRESRESKCLIMFNAYVDDSASDRDEKTLVLAAWVHRASVWSHFSDAWQIEIAKPPAVEYLRMAEAESLRGQFGGWDKKQRDRKVTSLANLIVGYERWFLECRVSRAKYSEILEPVIPYDLRGPYFPCFYAVILKLAHWHSSMGNTLPIDYVFDEQGPIGAEAVIWYEYTKSGQAKPIRELLGSTPVFRDDKKVMPLQAADLLAWHLRRRNEERYENEQREVMEILSQSLHAEVVVTEEVLRQLAAQMAALPGIALTRGKKDSIKPLLEQIRNRRDQD